MTLLKNMAIKYKLMTIIMLACVTGLLLAGATFIVWEQRTISAQMVKNLSTLAEMVGENCKAALTFEDNQDAEKTLEVLHVDSSIMFGGIYTNDGNIFAAYYRNNVEPEVQLNLTRFQGSGFGFTDGSLVVASPIILDKKIIGTVCLQSDLRAMYTTLKRSAMIIIAVLVLSSLAAFLVSSRLQTVISKPILSLAGIAKSVSEEKDYSVRAVKENNDEVGLLIDSFNEMLVQIQERDSELRDAKEGLEVKVEERTLELSKTNEQMTREITDRRTAQEELGKLLSLHSATLESTADGILVVDLQGKVVSYNQKFLQLWQIPEHLAKDGTDQKVLESVLDQLKDPGGFLDEAKRLYSNPLAQSLDILEFKDGRVYERCSQPQRIENRVVGRVWSFRDITDRKFAERAIKESKKMLELVMNNIPQFIFWKDRNSTYLGCNTNFAKAAGFERPEDVIGKTDHDMAWTKEEADSYTEYDKKVMDADMPQYHIIEQQRQTDGYKAWVDTNKVPLHDMDGKVVGILGSYEDITERKKAEEERERLNEELGSAVDKLEEANTELKNFVYIASHDLREPLRKITAFGSMLESSLKGKIDEDDAENLRFMIEGAARMTSMIEGLLAYSRVSTKAREAESVDLNEIVEQLRQLELSVLLEEKNVDLEVPEPLPSVKVDTAQIRQLLQNFIANGIKYQPAGNKPKIIVTSEPVGDGKVKISVKDNGIGIAPEYQDSVFAMFKRLHTRNEYEGTGIGLAVCKKIVERHGGEVGIISDKGQGSIFWFTVPAAGAAGSKEPAQGSDEPVQESKPAQKVADVQQPQPESKIAQQPEPAREQVQEPVSKQEITQNQTPGPVQQTESAQQDEAVQDPEEKQEVAQNKEQDQDQDQDQDKKEVEV
ncbi:MAG: PAS domain-containing protein [Sedimentisphaerales bacterium]|nr:PAS domain-containing protein [Sedimentisphaerales bacterium]